MRQVALLVLLLAGCSASPGVAPSPATPAATAASATPTAESTPEPTAAPSATTVISTVYTADDDEIAKLIKAGAAEAIPDLKLLNDMDPSKLEGQFLPWANGSPARRPASRPTSRAAARRPRSSGSSTASTSTTPSGSSSWPGGTGARAAMPSRSRRQVRPSLRSRRRWSSSRPTAPPEPPDRGAGPQSSSGRKMCGAMQELQIGVADSRSPSGIGNFRSGKRHSTS